MATRRRARTKSGRFTKKRRSNPRRTYRTKRRGTRKGQVRRTARRAYVPKRRARRRNPKGFTPGTRYAMWASGGAIAGFYLDGYEIPGISNIAAAVPSQAVTNSTVAAALAIVLGQFVLKGTMKNNIRALGIGMLVPTVGNVITNREGAFDAKPEGGIDTLKDLGGNGNGGAYGRFYAGGGRRPQLKPGRAYINPYLASSRGLNVA